jgi:hypothetical protein
MLRPICSQNPELRKGPPLSCWAESGVAFATLRSSSQDFIIGCVGSRVKEKTVS